MQGHGTEIPDFEFAARLLVESSEPPTWKILIDRLDDVFRANADLGQLNNTQRGKETSGGRALPPGEAAECLKDHIRTARFAKGLHSAICAAQQKFTERPIRVLYAGCGPFATFAMIVAPLFDEGEVEFTALDIYETSLACARGVAQCLGQANKFREFKYADATKYKTNGWRPHIIITETMQSQLLTEPQPQITANLGDQTAEGGFFLPELVEVTAFSADVNGETLNGFPMISEMEKLGQVFELTPDIAKRIKDERGEIDEQKLKAALSIDVTFEVRGRAGKLSRFMLETRVQIFGENVLYPDCSIGITNRAFEEWNPISDPVQAEISYVAGMDDQIVFRRRDGSENEAISRIRNVTLRDLGTC
ncbi:MAG: hypothetical protein AAB606_04950 [Patescibacteria group bacterium]